ncbi:MAG TPA: ABC transporter permease, partial [Bacteroidia bacterium]|nr:ABC transporter permease [Bacteroidia bacterium]
MSNFNVYNLYKRSGILCIFNQILLFPGMVNRVIIEPGAKRKNYWRDLWKFRGLFYFLAWRDVIVRYKQAVIGIAWSVIKPLLTILIFAVVGKLLHIPVPAGVPRVVFVCAAILPWQFFSTAFSESSNSLLANSNLLTKVYFPRLIVPASTIIVSLIDFFTSVALMILFMLYYHYVPGWNIILMPLFLLQATMLSMGAGIFIGALNVKYRDFKFIVPFMVQFGLYISPVAFSSDTVFRSQGIPQVLKYVYSLNPMVGVIDGFRWCILGGGINLYLPGFLFSIGISLLIFIVGIWYFRRTEHSF